MFFIISKKSRYETSYIYSSSHIYFFNIVFTFIQHRFSSSTSSFPQLEHNLINHAWSSLAWSSRSNRKKWKVTQSFSSTCIWKITIPRSTYRTSEMLITFNECVRYRSIRRTKGRKILRRIHNEFCSQRFPPQAILVIAIQWKFFLRATQSTIFFIGQPRGIAHIRVGNM